MDRIVGVGMNKSWGESLKSRGCRTRSQDRDGSKAEKATPDSEDGVTELEGIGYFKKEEA